MVEVDAWVLDAYPHTAWARAAWATLGLGPSAGQAGLRDLLTLRLLDVATCQEPKRSWYLFRRP